MVQSGLTGSLQPPCEKNNIIYSLGNLSSAGQPMAPAIREFFLEPGPPLEQVLGIWGSRL